MQTVSHTILKRDKYAVYIVKHAVSNAFQTQALIVFHLAVFHNHPVHVLHHPLNLLRAPLSPFWFENAYCTTFKHYNVVCFIQCPSQTHTQTEAYVLMHTL